MAIMVSGAHRSRTNNAFIKIKYSIAFYIEWVILSFVFYYQNLELCWDLNNYKALDLILLWLLKADLHPKKKLLAPNSSPLLLPQLKKNLSAFYCWCCTLSFLKQVKIALRPACTQSRQSPPTHGLDDQRWQRWQGGSFLLRSWKSASVMSSNR